MNSKQLTQYLSCLSKVQVGDWLEYYVAGNGGLSKIPSPLTERMKVKQTGLYKHGLYAQSFPIIHHYGYYAAPSIVLIKRIIKQSEVATSPNLK